MLGVDILLKVTIPEMEDMLSSPQKGDVVIRFVVNPYNNYSTISILEDYQKFVNGTIYGVGTTVYDFLKKIIVKGDGYSVYFFPLEYSTYALYLFRGENIYLVERVEIKKEW